MTERIMVEIDLVDLVKLDTDLSSARRQVRECAQAAQQAAVQWQEEVDRVNGTLEGLRTALRHGLGLSESDWDGDIVIAAQRAWRATQGLVEGVLVDESVTELPGAWVQDGGPPVREPRVFDLDHRIAPSVYEVYDAEGRVWTLVGEDGERPLWQHGERHFLTEVNLLAAGPVTEVIYDDPAPVKAVITDVE